MPYFCIAFLILLSSVKLCAQESYLGLKNGLNLTSLNSEGESFVDIDDRYSFNTSFVYCFRSEKIPFGVSIEPGYTGKGARISSDTLDYKFHFLSIPITLDYYPTPNLKLSVGPEFSYLASARNHVNDSTSFSVRGAYDKWEMSLGASLSYSLNFFADLGIKYNTSLKSISAYDAILDRRGLYYEYFQVFLLLKVAN